MYTYYLGLFMEDWEFSDYFRGKQHSKLHVLV